MYYEMQFTHTAQLSSAGSSETKNDHILIIRSAKGV